MHLTFVRAIAAVLLALGLLAAQGDAQTLEDRSFRIEFERGQTAVTIRDSLSGSERLVYRFAAKAGQTLDIKLTSTTRLVEFVLYGPGTWPNGRPLASSSLVGALVPELNRYIGRTEDSGDYRVVIRHVRNLPIAGQLSTFRLDLSITGGSADGGVATQLPGDAAVTDTVAFWRVVGLKAGDKLNVRAGPGTSFRVVDQLVLGEVVKNEGCVEASGAQWCEVSRPGRPRESGWASARYLAASTAPKPGGGSGATQLPGDALVGNGNFNATGKAPCLVENRARQCPFGVIRRGRGNATLYIDLPSGSQRRIEFEGGRPVTSNLQAGIYAEYPGTGVVLVFIGTSERYTVEDAILFGG